MRVTNCLGLAAGTLEAMPTQPRAHGQSRGSTHLLRTAPVPPEMTALQVLQVSGRRIPLLKSLWSKERSGPVQVPTLPTSKSSNTVSVEATQHTHTQTHTPPDSTQRQHRTQRRLHAAHPHPPAPPPPRRQHQRLPCRAPPPRASRAAPQRRRLRWGGWRRSGTLRSGRGRCAS